MLSTIISAALQDRIEESSQCQRKLLTHDSRTSLSVTSFLEDLPMDEKKSPKQKNSDPTTDEILRKMLETPPQPRKPKIKEAEPEK
jgi:hypothetical protein